MNNLFKFIQKYSNFLVFILLEVVAFMLLFTHREYPKSYVLSTANGVIARHYERANNMQAYFSLRTTNDALEAENVRLRNEVVALRNRLEYVVEDSIYQYAHLDYSFIPAKVVQATTNSSHNYLTINKGKRDHVYPGMGVCSRDGVVGIVSTVGERFSIVIPLIHVQSHVSCKFANNGYYGTLEWGGNDIHHAQVSDVANHIKISEGDTLVSSGLTDHFPEGFPIAVVDKASVRKGDSYYSIRARLLVDFRSLNYVQLIRNNAYQELEELSNEDNH